ncbi:MAG: hypothetical protein NZ108_11015, partial [Bacteroidia bacterium]|nr:hypothetical protein [Bacteroidia bacterium]
SSSALDIFQKIEQSAHLYPYYDYANGYGIPQANYFFNSDTISKQPNWTITQTNDSLYIQIATPISPQNFYLQIRQSNKILYYEVKQIRRAWQVTYPKKRFPAGTEMRLHYEGKTMDILL